MTAQSVFIYDDAVSQHVLRQDHPMRPIRLRYTYELLDSYGAFTDSAQLIKPRPATAEEVSAFHTPDYIQAVRMLSSGMYLPGAAQYGFSAMGDNPVFPGMYEASLLSTGGTMVAAEMVAQGKVKAAFNISGGLHHAMASRASGFCVFNDPVVAIKYLMKQGMKVAYVDIDAHHGDGVQAAFYDTDQVLTISTHESGRFLFPGTGFVDEAGTGKGRGYSVNVPLFPYTGDDTYLWAFRESVIPLIKAFKPDVLFTQLGIDTHVRDPITHLQLTSRAFTGAVEEFAKLGLPWIATGGGGYDVMAVARCWTLAYGVMAGREWTQDIPKEYTARYGITDLRDGEPNPPASEIREQIDNHTQVTVEEIKKLFFPILKVD
jgi:acetoin utilization protein AcuC